MALPDDALELVMMRDNLTGLIWEVKTSKEGEVDYTNPHNADNNYFFRNYKIDNARKYLNFFENDYELIRLKNNILFLNRVTQLIDIEIIKTTDNDGHVFFDSIYRNNNDIKFIDNNDLQTTTLSISNISPQTGHVNGGTSVYITGANFTSGATVKFGGLAGTGGYIGSSGTSLFVDTPAHVAGSVDVIVTNPDGKSVTRTNGYTYSGSAPTITNISPQTGHVNGGTSVYITGSNFTSGATVTFGGLAGTGGFLGSGGTSLFVDTPVHAAGSVDVIVTNPDGKSVTRTNGYNYTGAAPTLVISPTSRSVSKDAGTTTFSVSNTGTGTMPWTAAVTSDSSWLSITSGASGTDTGTINCSFTSNIGTSARTATIRITAAGAIDSPVDVTVTQTLAPAPTLLWAETTGRASIWTMDMDANKTGEMLYGPYPDWTPKSYHKNSDGTANMLWGRADGYVSLWIMDASGNPTSMSYYGPYPDWTARSYHRNSDGTANMLWGRIDGYVSLWMMDASGNPTSMSYYGPYEGWTATCYHGNSDGAANMLWVRTDGYVSLWTMDASGNPTGMSYYGPYEGWTAKSYYRNSDGTANMLWWRADGYVSLWMMDASGNPTSMSYYGPYPGWTAQDYD